MNLNDKSVKIAGKTYTKRCKHLLEGLIFRTPFRPQKCQGQYLVCLGIKNYGLITP